MADPRTIIVPRAVRGDPARFLFNVSSYTVDAAQPLNFTVVRAGRRDQTVSVDWTTSTVSTSPGSGTVTFAPGEVTKVVNVNAGSQGGNGHIKLSNPQYISDGPVVLPELGASRIATLGIVGGAGAIYTDVALSPFSFSGTPIVINSIDQLENGVDAKGDSIKRFVSGISEGPDGFQYRYYGVTGNEDVVIDLRGEPVGSFIEHPIHIWNCRHVKVLGVYWSPPILPQMYAWPTEPYPYPKMPWNHMFRTQNRGSTWLEGCIFDCRRPSNTSALNGDYIVFRGSKVFGTLADFDGMTYTVQNCLFKGNADRGPGSAGDTMAHSDFWQNQGSTSTDIVKRPEFLSFDNCLLRTGGEGVVLHNRPSNPEPRLTKLYMRNCDVSTTDEFQGPFDNSGASPNGFLHNQTNLDPTSPDYWGNILTHLNIKFHSHSGFRGFSKALTPQTGNNVWLSAFDQTGSVLIPHPEITQYYDSINPHTEFVAKSGTGLGPGYISPHAHADIP